MVRVTNDNSAGRSRNRLTSLNRNSESDFPLYNGNKRDNPISKTDLLGEDTLNYDMSG